MSIEDLDAFLFKFDILFRSYNYNHDGHKLKLFPTTLKDSALRCFMGLDDDSILTWDDMKKAFLKKYHDYFHSRHTKEDIFNMQQREEEILEDYVERFLYNLQKAKKIGLRNETIITLFKKGIKDGYLYVLNLMGFGDISHFPITYIYEVCKIYSRSRNEFCKNIRDPISRVTKSTFGGVTKD